jgi:Domain of unknown function (DU1801)
MAADAIAEYLDGVVPEVRPLAGRLVSVVASQATLTAAVKWRQLTFAVDGDFDHWVCAVSATTRSAAVIFHFGSLLQRDEFDPSKAKFTRRITYRSVDDVHDDVVGAILAQAIETLPAFRRTTARRVPPYA